MAILTPGPIPEPSPGVRRIGVSFSSRSCSEGDDFLTMDEAVAAITTWLKGLNPVEHHDAGPWRIEIDLVEFD